MISPASQDSQVVHSTEGRYCVMCYPAEQAVGVQLNGNKDVCLKHAMQGLIEVPTLRVRMFSDVFCSRDRSHPDGPEQSVALWRDSRLAPDGIRVCAQDGFHLRFQRPDSRLVFDEPVVCSGSHSFNQTASIGWLLSPDGKSLRVCIECVMQIYLKQLKGICKLLTREDVQNGDTSGLQVILDDPYCSMYIQYKYSPPRKSQGTLGLRDSKAEESLKLYGPESVPEAKPYQSFRFCKSYTWNQRTNWGRRMGSIYIHDTAMTFPH